MTRQDRELAIADNLAYVDRALEAVLHEWSAFAHQAGDELRRDEPPLVLAGFSQGVAMAFRAACATARHVDGVIAVGGDVPPEIDAASLAHVQTALVCRGARDEWYTEEKFRHDAARIQEAGAAVLTVAFDGGHEWSAAVLDAASAFLLGVMERRR